MKSVDISCDCGKKSISPIKALTFVAVILIIIFLIATIVFLVAQFFGLEEIAVEKVSLLLLSFITPIYCFVDLKKIKSTGKVILQDGTEVCMECDPKTVRKTKMGYYFFIILCVPFFFAFLIGWLLEAGILE